MRHDKLRLKPLPSAAVVATVISLSITCWMLTLSAASSIWALIRSQ